MKKYPLVIQDELKDCGVSCIQMILKYYKGYVKKQTLLDLTKTNKEGTTFYNIKQTLIKLGFDVKGISCNLNDITNDNIILPCIANVIINNSYKHFIVIYEINYKNKYLIIGDPANKIKKIKYLEFEQIFNNKLLIFFPIKSIPIEKNISKYKFIIQCIKPHKQLLTNIIILSIFITIMSIIISFYTEYMIKAINIYSKQILLLTFCVFFPIYIIKIISEYFRNILLSYVNQKIDLELTLDIFKKIIKLPYCYYKNKTTGDILSRINDIDNIRNMISRVALSLFIDLPLTIVASFVLYFINKTLFVIGIIMLILFLISMVIFKGFFYDYIRKIQNGKSESISYMVESISGFETVKGIHIEDKIINRFEKKYVKFLKNVFKYQNLYFLQNFFNEVINNIGIITITFVGGVLVINNKIGIGTLLTFISLLTYFIQPIRNIMNFNNEFKEANISLQRILELIIYDKENDGVINYFKPGNIEIKKIDFTYNERDYVLKDINLNINKNSKVMVVGKSGSGKSTLFKLLLRLYRVNNNKIFINNIDINNYTKKSINENILYLNQNEILFNDTLYNNLIFDSNNSCKLLDISKICCLEEIMNNNLGYNMLIEENGFNLSGGERQRIMLARTLLKNFEILIIDEGLNQVDVDLERKILKNIFNYFKEKTIIVISHRLDNLDLFDSLIRLENSGVKEVFKNG